jgi:putative SOS response-associated peptidase YedK
MCGRYVTRREAEIERLWNYGWPRRAPESDVVRKLGSLFNAAPTQWLPVFRKHAERGPELVRLRWGLVPSWSKDATIGVKLINARGETVGEKASFRAAFRRRRCVVPMAGFYEWQRSASRKVPYYVHLLNAEIFGVAGLYEYWPGKEGAEPLETFTIITTDANETVARLHDRMPVILAERDFDAWLDPKNEKTDTLQPLLKPYPSEEMRAYAVSTRVNNARNDGPELIEPATPGRAGDREVESSN